MPAMVMLGGRILNSSHLVTCWQTLYLDQAGLGIGFKVMSFRGRIGDRVSSPVISRSLPLISAL